jgi:hypothetical protein
MLHCSIGTQSLTGSVETLLEERARKRHREEVLKAMDVIIDSAIALPGSAICADAAH